MISEIAKYLINILTGGNNMREDDNNEELTEEMVQTILIGFLLTKYFNGCIEIEFDELQKISSKSFSLKQRINDKNKIEIKFQEI